MAPTYAFGKFVLNVDEQTLSLAGELLRLPQKEFEILKMLIENNGRLLTKDAMMSAIWKDTFVEESNLAQYISRIRKTLNVDGNEYIETVSKRGYRFRADLIETPGVTTLERQITLQITNDPSPVSKSIGEIASLAVVPFRPLGGKSDDDFLGLGLADALITQLTRAGSLVVTPTTSVSKIGDQELDPVVIGKQLGVDAILLGNFQTAGTKLRLTVQMFETTGGKPLWAESFNSEMDDIFEVQDRIAKRIVDAFASKLSVESQEKIAKRFTEDSRAYQEYLRGRVFFAGRTTDGLSNALKHFNRAIELDPQYALAYTGVSDVYQLLPNTDMMGPENASLKARAAALRALELDDSIAEAHLSIAVCMMNYDWNFAGAEVSFKKAIELNPNLAQTHLHRGTMLLRLGQIGDGVVELNRARTLDPLSPGPSAWLAEAFAGLGKFDAAIRMLLEVTRVAPEYSLAHYFLATTFLRAGRINEASAAVENALLLSDDMSLIRSARTLVRAFSGDISGARLEIDNLIAKREQTYVSATNIASGFAGIRDSENVFKWLEIAYKEKDSHITWINFDFEFDYLHDDARFTNILRRVNLPANGSEKPAV